MSNIIVMEIRHFSDIFVFFLSASNLKSKHAKWLKIYMYNIIKSVQYKCIYQSMFIVKNTFPSWISEEYKSEFIKVDRRAVWSS